MCFNSHLLMLEETAGVSRFSNILMKVLGEVLYKEYRVISAFLAGKLE